MGSLKDLWGLLKERKKFWLLPATIVVVVVGFMIVVAGTSALAPLVYTLF